MAEQGKDIRRRVKSAAKVQSEWARGAFFWKDPNKHFLRAPMNAEDRQAIEGKLSPIMESFKNQDGLILDVGSAGMSEFYYPKELLPRIVAVDISPEALQANTAGHKMLADIRRKLGFEDGSFIGVSMFFVNRYLENQLEVMEELWRVLKPGGRFVMIDYTDSEQSFQVAKFEPNYLRDNSVLAQSTDQEIVQLTSGLKGRRGRVLNQVSLMTGKKPLI